MVSLYVLLSVVEPLRSLIYYLKILYSISNLSSRNISISSSGAKVDTIIIGNEKEKLDIIFVCAGGDPFSYTNSKVLIG